MLKVAVVFSFPGGSLQLFAAVLHSLHPREPEGQRFCSCLAAINSGCWPLDLLSGDVLPNAFLCSSRTLIPSKTNSEDLL